MALVEKTETWLIQGVKAGTTTYTATAVGVGDNADRYVPASTDIKINVEEESWKTIEGPDGVFLAKDGTVSNKLSFTFDIYKDERVILWAVSRPNPTLPGYVGSAIPQLLGTSPQYTPVLQAENATPYIVDNLDNPTNIVAKLWRIEQFYDMSKKYVKTQNWGDTGGNYYTSIMRYWVDTTYATAENLKGSVTYNILSYPGGSSTIGLKGTISVTYNYDLTRVRP